MTGWGVFYALSQGKSKVDEFTAVSVECSPRIESLFEEVVFHLGN